MDPIDFFFRIFLLLVVLFVILQPIFALFQRKEEKKTTSFEPAFVPEKKKKEVKIKKKPHVYKPSFNKIEEIKPVISRGVPILSKESSKKTILSRFSSLKDAIIVSEIIGPPKSKQ